MQVKQMVTVHSTGSMLDGYSGEITGVAGKFPGFNMFIVDFGMQLDIDGERFKAAVVPESCLKELD